MKTGNRLQVYADNAAATKICPQALQAMLAAYENIYANPSSSHSAGQQALACLEEARATVAQCVDAQPEEVYFTSGGSEADNQALLTGAFLGARMGKRHIISTAFEHHAVLRTLQRLEKQGFRVTLLEIDRETHNITAQQVQEAIREDTCLVSVMYANNEIGSVLPIREIGGICRQAGVLFHVDGVQAVGHIPVSMESDQIDLLSLSGHKFHGPRGTGALCCRRGIQPVSLILGGPQERKGRAGTEDLPGICGMAAALREACGHMSRNREQVTVLRDQLIHRLSRIPGAQLNGDPVNRLPGNVSFCFEGIQGEGLLLLLDAWGISASGGSACTSGVPDPSHVLLAIGRSPELARSGLRLSLSRYNTREEADYTAACVEEAVDRLRGASS